MTSGDCPIMGPGKLAEVSRPGRDETLWGKNSSLRAKKFLRNKNLFAWPGTVRLLTELQNQPGRENKVRKGLSHKQKTKSRQFQGAKNANHLQASVICSTKDPVGGGSACHHCRGPLCSPTAVSVSLPMGVPAESPRVCTDGSAVSHGACVSICWCMCMLQHKSI